MNTNTNSDVVLSNSSDSNDTVQVPWPGKPPPLYQMDLSLPPQSRYSQICDAYKLEMADLVGIYNNLLSFTQPLRFFPFLAKNLLKRVQTDQKTQEIPRLVPIHLVVAYIPRFIPRLYEWRRPD